MAKNLRGFRRISLAEQAAETLINAIASGEMSDPLPGEMQLSECLKVSRPTVRRAIAILAEKGLVITAKGKRTRIVNRKKRKPTQVDSVCFIISAPLRSASIVVSSLLDEIKFELTAEGVPWDAIYESQLGGVRPETRLKEIVADRQNTCYVLLLSSLVLQRWFEKSGKPVLVMGSCHEGVDLPSIDLDNRAVGWHAGGQFVKNGHTNILVVEPVGRAVGISASEASLREYMARVQGSQVRVLKATPSFFLTAFERALRGPNPPTAALACRVEMALSVLGAAQQFGKCIPREFSLVARDDHPIFEVMVPDITRYQANVHAMARKTIRLIYLRLQGIEPRNKTTLIFPTFFPGQTLRSI